MAIGLDLSGARRRLVLGAALGLFAGCTQPEPGNNIAGSGTELGNVIGILKSIDRTAAAGVEVVLYPVGDSTLHQPILKTTTDAGGAFAFKDVDGSYRLLAVDGPHGVTVDSLRPSPADTIKLNELELAPLGGIQGFVKSAPFGSTLGLVGTPFDTAFEGDAEFVLEGIPAGKYWLRAAQANRMTAPESRQIPVQVVAGTITELPDTLDLGTLHLSLHSAQFPYRFHEMVRPADGIPVDSVFGTLNGVRLADDVEDLRIVGFSLTETQIDTSRPNHLQLHVRSGDSTFVVRSWTITWNRHRPTLWAYQAVRAVIESIVPDGRPKARFPGPQGGNPQLGTFRVLESRKLTPGERELWQWPAVAGAETLVEDSLQATIRNIHPILGRGCRDWSRPPLLPLPGDTVTFFLLPDTNLGGIAYRLRTDERFQDMDRLGYFARAEWPLIESLHLIERTDMLYTSLRPEGLRIELPWRYAGEPGCLSTFRRFLVDSAGGVREVVATPPGIEPSSLLLHYRAQVGNSIDPDTLPQGGVYVYVDSTGRGRAGNPDSIRTFQLSDSALHDLKTLLSGLPNPIPAAWHERRTTMTRVAGVQTRLRYLVGDGRGAVHVVDHAEASPAKADFFSRVEAWLRGQGHL